MARACSPIACSGRSSPAASRRGADGDRDGRARVQRLHRRSAPEQITACASSAWRWETSCWPRTALCAAEQGWAHRLGRPRQPGRSASARAPG
jgi:hypothetical protein